MKSLTEQLWFEIPARRGYINITGTVSDLVHKSGVQEGLARISAKHLGLRQSSRALRGRS